jgi:Uma2 family endonuclease
MTATALKPAADRRMTFEEYLDWLDEDTRAEWVDGEVEFVSPVTLRHALVTSFINHLLVHFVALHHLGQVLQEPYLMRLAKIRRGRIPDILFGTNENLERLTNLCLDLPADLAVEVVSPGSRKRDREDKFKEYQAAGIREYRLIDAPRDRAEFFVLDELGVYRPATIDRDGRFQSTVLRGFWPDTNWLWQDPLPNALSVTNEWRQA